MTDMTEERCSHGKDANIHPPIYWNPFNKVFQCHKCGAIFEEQEVSKGLVEALEYCAVEPKLLQPKNNRQCAVATNALAAYKARTEGKVTDQEMAEKIQSLLESIKRHCFLETENKTLRAERDEALKNLEKAWSHHDPAIMKLAKERDEALRWKEAYHQAFIEHFRSDCLMRKAEEEVEDRARRIFEEGK